ncbi:MAG: hypothetical protein WBG02_15475 [Candidatus Acidiferrum sp.]
MSLVNRLSAALQYFESSAAQLHAQVSLPEKDVPILLGAIAARAAHLITGDLRHFGPFFGKKLANILVLPPPITFAAPSQGNSRESL